MTALAVACWLTALSLLLLRPRIPAAAWHVQIPLDELLDDLEGLGLDDEGQEHQPHHDGDEDMMDD